MVSMNSRTQSVLISFWLHLFVQWSGAIKEESGPMPKGFLAHRAVTSLQKYCTCPVAYSCSCCQSVIILYTKAERNLCVNFTYQRNGLNIDVTLKSTTIKTRRVTDYKPLKFCINVPGCLFSSACISVLELNQFARSITACLRLDIFSKKRLWQINYDCVSILTELPMVAGNSTMKTMNGTGGSSGTTMKPTSAMSTTKMMVNTTTMMPTTKTTVSATTVMKIESETEETTPDVEIITVPGSASTTIVDID
ncbi:uncharacterized protein LOC143373043 [Andrena cerasifolii]|uniref:uncharacterized protein LOC143373043 n=1 Tax=Andrena cerasifolii TaxID=2819439 RepID=UPI004037A51B